MIGAGGMGEVYRAHDARLGRDVALKILRSAVTADHVERLGREARAAGSLNHPNIVAVFDVGVHEDLPYVVSELLDGQSLGRRLEQGRLSYRKALEYGMQIAQALGAAHARGICHRDVKPENVFITSDGRAKLLDFGLVKVQSPREPVGSDDPTADNADGGAVHGTVGYMSPEQAVGAPVDHRTDLFSLGVVLYEMFTGTRAFRRGSTVETMRALLRDDPPDPLKLNPALPAAAAEVVMRCLEKNREERFQSARDLAFELQQLYRAESGTTPRMSARLRRASSIRWVAVGLAVTGIAILVGLLIPRAPEKAAFDQLTFHRGRIGGARFASEGVVYSQAPEADALAVWHRLRDSPEPRALGYAADVLAARGGEVALCVRRRLVSSARFVGTLAVAPIVGGTPREILDDVEDADWSPTGTELAVARCCSGPEQKSRLEYPPGRLLHETRGGISHVRFSPDGRRLAFLEDAAGAGIGGRVAVVEIGGGHRFLTEEWASARGLTWSPGGDEIWFTAAGGRMNRALRAVALDGRSRLVLEAPGSLTVWDASRDGRVLLTRDDERRAVVGVPPGATLERDLSWFDTSGLADLSADGRTLLIGDRLGIYTRGTDGAAPRYLGLKDGYADALSPDGRFALAESPSNTQLLILPTAAGDSHVLPAGSIATYGGAIWFPDGRRVLVNGMEPGHGPRAYVQDVPDGAPRPLSPENTWALSISPDGESVAAIERGKGISVVSVGGGSLRHVPGSEPGDRPVRFSADGRSLWVFRRGEVPMRVFLVDVESGRRTLWKTLVPPDPAGVYSIVNFQVTPTGNAYFYGYVRVLSELYVVTGVR